MPTPTFVPTVRHSVRAMPALRCAYMSPPTLEGAAEQHAAALEVVRVGGAPREEGVA